MLTRILRTVVAADTGLGPRTGAQIVPMATYYLICAIATWTVVEHITLMNVSCLLDELRCTRSSRAVRHSCRRSRPFAHAKSTR